MNFIILAISITVLITAPPAPVDSYRVEFAKTSGNYLPADKVDNLVRDSSGRILFNVEESVFKFYRIRGVKGTDIGFPGPERSTVNFPVAPTDAERTAN